MNGSRLGPEQLRALRDAASDEALAGIRGGASRATLKQFAQLVAEIDRRLDHVDPDTFARRQMISATRSPTFHTGGQPRGSRAGR